MTEEIYTVTDTPTAERYVAGRLNDEETERFEAEMVERPELAADVATRQRIKAGLALLEERNELAPLLESDRARSGYRRWGIAAVIAAVVGPGGWIALQSSMTAGTGVLLASNQLDGRPVTDTFIFALTRSQPDTPTVVVHDDTGLVHIQLLVAELRGDVRVTLERKRAGSPDEPISDPIAVSASENGLIDMYLNLAKLESGAYELELSDADSATQRFGFALDFALGTPTTN